VVGEAHLLLLADEILAERSFRHVQGLATNMPLFIVLGVQVDWPNAVSSDTAIEEFEEEEEGPASWPLLLLLKDSFR